MKAKERLIQEENGKRGGKILCDYMRKTSPMEVGICCHPKDIAALPANAFDFLEVNVQGFLIPEREEAEFIPHLEAAQNSVKPIRSANCFLPGDLRCIGTELDEARLMRYAETAFRRAAQTGIELIVFGSGGARKIPEGYPPAHAVADFVHVLRRLGPIAQHHGITLVIEPLNKAECNFINSLAEGADVVKRCGHPNVRLLADSYHMFREGEPVSEVLRFGHLLKHVHVAELAGRSFPGKSREDFHPFFQALRQSGYTGSVSLECTWGHIESELESSTRYLREQMVAEV